MSFPAGEVVQWKSPSDILLEGTILADRLEGVDLVAVRENEKKETYWLPRETLQKKRKIQAEAEPSCNPPDFKKVKWYHKSPWLFICMEYLEDRRQRGLNGMLWNVRG